jgi:DNA-directed RNA polymerase subunit F
MNKKISKSVEKRILQIMKKDEDQLRLLLATETNGVPDEQLDGLMIKIEQLLGRIMVNQNKIMLLQSIIEDDS